MRVYLLLYLILFISSCEFYSHNNWNTKTIRLGDSTSYIGQLQLKLPKEYDSIIRWNYYGDNEGADYQNTRIQSKKYPSSYDTINYKKHNDFFGSISQYDYPDSLFGLTLSYRKDNFNPFNAKKYIDMIRIHQMENNPSDSISIKNMVYNIVDVNGLDFVTHEDISSRSDANYLITNRSNLSFTATTIFDGSYIHFRFENSTTNFKKEDYFKTCLEILETVKFSK